MKKSSAVEKKSAPTPSVAGADRHPHGPTPQPGDRSAALSPLAAREALAVEIKTIVRPVSNAIAILRHLGQHRRPDTTTRIAKELKLNPSTCFNILRTLTKEGMVDFDPIAKTYSLSLGLAKLAGSALSASEHLGLAKPHMQELAEQYGVTVALWRRVGGSRIVLVFSESSSRGISIRMEEGLRIPLLIGTTGRVMALKLGLSKAELRKEFKALRWARELSFETYWEEVLLAEKRGWAVDDGYFSAGIMTVGAAVETPQGEPTFSLVAHMFRDQHGPETIERIGTDIARLASTLTRIIY